MFDNLDKFNKDVMDFADDFTPREFKKLRDRIGFEAFRRIAKRTARDRGLTVKRWRVAIGTTVPTDALAASGSSNVGVNQLNTIRRARWFEPVIIFNNSPHIFVLEDGGFVPKNPGPSKDKRKGRKGRILVKGGYSVQSPQGMVKVTVEELAVLFG